jgi:hypothetical protein
MTENQAYTDQEWGLLVGLPQAVAVAASAVQRDSASATRAEFAAGQEAISAGRESASPLVFRVSEALLTQLGDPEEGAEPPIIRPADPDAVRKDALERIRQANALLRGHEDAGEAAAYKHWLVEIAEAVVSAATSGGVLGIGGQRIAPAEQDFIHELTVALGD